LTHVRPPPETDETVMVALKSPAQMMIRLPAAAVAVVVCAAVVLVPVVNAVPRD
jgi:hypothetical protein